MASCRDRHMGVWLIEPNHLIEHVALFRSGALPTMQADDGDGDSEEPEVQGGIAVLNIAGRMVKGGSSFGGTNTLALRSAVRSLARDRSIDAVVMVIDSPGGTAAGMDELTSDIAALAKAKPVFAQIDDLGASAAYWAAVMAGKGRVAVNRMGLVGSIGAVSVIEDTSEMAEMEGVKVHVLTSQGADMKAAGAPGTEVTDEHLEKFQGIVDRFGTAFVQSVARARGIETKAIRGLRGDVFSADEALERGLVDSVRSLDDTIKAARQTVAEQRQQARQTQSRRNRVEIAKRL